MFAVYQVCYLGSKTVLLLYVFISSEPADSIGIGRDTFESISMTVLSLLRLHDHVMF